MKKTWKLGIIGIGPRGLYALERLILKLSEKASNDIFHILLFEKTGNYGNGQVYDINQVSTNWINVAERVLCLNKRRAVNWGEIQLPAFPSYHEWIKLDTSKISEKQPDIYPPRAKIGKYLQQRFKTFIMPLLQANIASLHNECVENVIPLDSGKIRIKTNFNDYEPIDELLLTIGHQLTYPAEQIQKWEEYFKDNHKVFLFKNPYPVKNFLNCQGVNKGSSIGIRGFGLAMIDVVRGIATQYGEFKMVDETTKKCAYYPVTPIVNLLVPFSLDGLPPSPKPLNAQVDNLYKPTDKQLDTFEELIGNSVVQRKATTPLFLIQAISPIIAKVFSLLPQTVAQSTFTTREIERVVHEWLIDESFDHSLITSIRQPVVKMMQSFVDMATGYDLVSLDFCIGQVWRHCQPSIYEQLSFNKCSAEVFAAIIRLDERMKRYAYGPPVESIQQILALVSAGVMTLDFVNNPQITLSAKGWELKCGKASISVNVMIDSVLDAPEIKSVNTPIVKQLLSNDIIKVVHDDFGVSTDENGYLIPQEKVEAIPIALLGRLAKGTIIGVDAILECFGSRPQAWAAAAAKHHPELLKKN